MDLCEAETVPKQADLLQICQGHGILVSFSEGFRDVSTDVAPRGMSVMETRKHTVRAEVIFSSL